MQQGSQDDQGQQVVTQTEPEIQNQGENQVTQNLEGSPQTTQQQDQNLLEIEQLKQHITQLENDIKSQEAQINQKIEENINFQSIIDQLQIQHEQELKDLNERILTLEKEKERVTNDLSFYQKKIIESLRAQFEEAVNEKKKIQEEIKMISEGIDNRITHKQFFQDQDLQGILTIQDTLNLEKTFLNFINESKTCIQVDFTQHDLLNNGKMVFCSNITTNLEEQITIKEYIKQDFQLRKQLLQIIAEGLKNTIFLGAGNEFLGKLQSKLDELQKSNDVSVDQDKQVYRRNHEKFFTLFTEVFQSIIQQTKISSEYLLRKQKEIGTIVALQTLQQKYSMAQAQ